MNNALSLSVLRPAQVERLQEASLGLLADTGIRFGGSRALELLRAQGLTVGTDGLVKLPRELVSQALASAPKQITLHTRDGQPAFDLKPGGPQYFGTHADQLELMDPFAGGIRDFTQDDVPFMCRLADALPNISFVLSVGLTKDTPAHLCAQATFWRTLKNFRLPINFSTNDLPALTDIIAMAQAAAGGPEALRAKPFCFYYCEPVPPLTVPLESTEKLIMAAQAGIPTVFMPYCMMGGTGPMSLGGALLQSNAEILAGLVVQQLAVPGAPFIYGLMPSIMDMKTTVGSYGAPEFHLGVAAAAQLAHAYGLPFYGTGGCSDAKLIDEQAVAEVTMELMSTMLSGANLVHDLAVMDHCKSVSPEMLVLIDEIITMLGSYTRGIDTDGEELGLEVIQRVGPGGAYLTDPHTFARFRGVWYPGLFSRDMKMPDQSQVRGRVLQRLTQIRDHHLVPALEAPRAAAVDAVARRIGLDV